MIQPRAEDEGDCGTEGEMNEGEARQSRRDPTRWTSASSLSEVLAGKRKEGGVGA